MAFPMNLTDSTAAQVRAAARRDLGMAFRETLRWKLQYVLMKGGAVHPLAVDLWNRWRIP